MLEIEINNTLGHIIKWLYANNLKINLIKTYIMQFHLKNQNLKQLIRVFRIIPLLIYKLKKY